MLLIIHKTNLWKDSFEAIKCGFKTVKMRLNDEKRRLIKIGDEIEFVNTETNEVLICEVIGLYKNHDKVSIGYAKDENANPNDMKNMVY